MLRILVWSAAAAGVLVAFAWPFLVSSDPGDPAMRVTAIAITLVFLAALAAAASMRAVRGGAAARR